MSENNNDNTHKNDDKNTDTALNPLQPLAGIGALVVIFFGIKMCHLGGGITFWDLACPPIVMTYHICKGIALYLSVSMGVAFIISVITGLILSFLLAYCYAGKGLFKD